MSQDNFNNNFPPQPPNFQSVPQKIINLETSYAWLYFLGSFGAHKYYMKQTGLWFWYPLSFVILALFNLVPIIGPLIYIVGLVAFVLNIYVDIRTMKEQISRVESGEVFTVKTQLDLFKRVILDS